MIESSEQCSTNAYKHQPVPTPLVPVLVPVADPLVFRQSLGRETDDGKSRQENARSGRRTLEHSGGQTQGHRIVATSWIRVWSITLSELIHQTYQREKVEDVAQWRDAVKFPSYGSSAVLSYLGNIFAQNDVLFAERIERMVQAMMMITPLLTMATWT